MHLIVNQVVELQHVHVAHGDRPIKPLATSTVIKRQLAAIGQLCHAQQLFDRFLTSTIKYWRRHGDTGPQVLGQCEQFIITQ